MKYEYSSSAKLTLFLHEGQETNKSQWLEPQLPVFSIFTFWP